MRYAISARDSRDLMHENFSNHSSFGEFFDVPQTVSII